MADLTLDTVFAGRTMALDRSTLPALTSRALARTGAANLAELARRGDGFSDAALSVRRIGSTTVIPLTGVITADPFLRWLMGGTSPDALVLALEQAVADPSARTIVLLVDSPGGEVALVTETAAQIRGMRTSKPIVAIARPMMASAAYWLASQASTVVATPSATIGSLGVFMAHVEQSRLNDRLGVSITYIASDAKKVEANPDHPLADDARAFIQSRVDQTYALFVNDVAAGRGTTAAVVRAQYGAGRAFGAEEAVRRGLVDRIGTLDETIAREAGLAPRGKLRASVSDDDRKRRLLMF
jgi:signal peptide peptidase SppA